MFLGSATSVFINICWVIIAFGVVWGVTWLVNRYRMHHYATVLKEDEFQAGMRKAQVIDVRSESDFKKGHILGARNLPYAFLRTQYGEIRPDLPVYLYDAGTSVAAQAAKFLSKQGFQKLYILDGGFLNWQGKTKKDKYAD